MPTYSTECPYCHAIVNATDKDEFTEHYHGAFLCKGSLTRVPAIQNPTREQITEAWNNSQAYHDHEHEEV